MQITGSDSAAVAEGSRRRPLRSSAEVSATGAFPTLAPIHDDDVLLGKEANEEQVQIIRRLSHSGSVIVQGPPGTGKTHTIANLIGHQLAQGKSILVTAQTAKALRVLRDKVPEVLRPLCVAVLGSDDDARRQLETSIGSITERLTTQTSGLRSAARASGYDSGARNCSRNRRCCSGICASRWRTSIARSSLTAGVSRRRTRRASSRRIALRMRGFPAR